MKFYLSLKIVLFYTRTQSWILHSKKTEGVNTGPFLMPRSVPSPLSHFSRDRPYTFWHPWWSSSESNGSRFGRCTKNSESYFTFIPRGNKFSVLPDCRLVTGASSEKVRAPRCGDRVTQYVWTSTGTGLGNKTWGIPLPSSTVSC